MIGNAIVAEGCEKLVGYFTQADAKIALRNIFPIYLLITLSFTCHLVILNSIFCMTKLYAWQQRLTRSELRMEIMNLVHKE